MPAKKKQTMGEKAMAQYTAGASERKLDHDQAAPGQRYVDPSPNHDPLARDKKSWPDRNITAAPADATVATTPPWMKQSAPSRGDVTLANPSTPNEIRGAMRNPTGSTSATGDEADGMRPSMRKFLVDKKTGARTEEPLTESVSDQMADEAGKGFRSDVRKKIAAQKRARS